MNQLKKNKQQEPESMKTTYFDKYNNNFMDSN